MSVYVGARTVHGNSDNFEMEVGMRQGSALGPLLFVIVLETIVREFRDTLPWQLLYAAMSAAGTRVIFYYLQGTRTQKIAVYVHTTFVQRKLALSALVIVLFVQQHRICIESKNDDTFSLPL